MNTSTLVKQKFHFTFENLKEQYQKTLDYGYEIVRCVDYLKLKKEGLPQKLLVNRIDIDFSVKKARKLGEIFNELGIKGTFFIRLHAPEYNPFSFENYRIVRYLIDTGHEIGYHSEVVDQAAIWNENIVECFKRDLDVFKRMYGVDIKGVASHGGMTGLNNLDFWKDRKASDFGLLYEAYDKQPEFNIFQESFYVSDSEWTRWKCYNKGDRVDGDHRSLAEHIEDNHPILHVLIHSDTYFDNHFYENEK